MMTPTGSHTRYPRQPARADVRSEGARDLTKDMCGSDANGCSRAMFRTDVPHPIPAGHRLGRLGMKIKLAVSAAALAVMLAGPALAQDKPQLAFVVNAASDFWKLAEAGVNKAQEELPGYELQFRYPAQGTAALQNALMDDLVAAGTDAIMISSADPKNSVDAFNRIAAQVPLFTTDSDAPSSNRIAYLGSSNTLAGVQAGEIAVEAMPDGGKCMGF